MLIRRTEVSSPVRHKARERKKGNPKAGSLEDSKQTPGDERLRQSLAKARFPVTNKQTTSPAAAPEKASIDSRPCEREAELASVGQKKKRDEASQ
jgi:hypothetical protein